MTLYRHLLLEAVTVPNLALAVGLLFFIAARPAKAQSDDAKIAFEAGIDAFHAGEFAAAKRAFDTSYAIRPVPKVLFNIAMCEKAMYRYAEALDILNRYLEQADLGEADSFYKEVAAEKADLLSKVGRVNIRSTPTGAEVYLDGKPAGKTPMSPGPRVNPGEHTVEVRKDGYEVFNRQVSVTPGASSELRVILELEQGTVEIRCPEGARLRLDGRQNEPCPFFGTLKAGSHRLTLTQQGRSPIERAFVLDADERLSLDLLDTRPATSRTAAKDTRGRRNPVLLSIGIVSSTLAVGAAALGGYFIHQGENAYDDALSAIENGDRARYDEMDRERLPSYRLGTTLSFVGAGVSLAAGVVLIAIGSQKKSREDIPFKEYLSLKTVQLRPLGVRFYF